MSGCDRAYANVLGKGNRIFPFSIRLRNHYPSKNKARVVDVSLLCIYMRLYLGVFYLPFYEFELSDESLLLCDNGQLHYHIQLKKIYVNVSFWVTLLVVQ